MPDLPPTLLPTCLSITRRRLLLLGGVASATLAGCAGLGGPQVITLGQADLDRLLARSFPMQRKLLALLDVTLTAPRLQLLPDRNRIAVRLDLASHERLSGLAGRARLDFDSALRYEPRDASLRLTQVRVQQLSLDAGSLVPADAAAPAAGAAGRLARLGQALVETALDELALYSVPAERLADLRRLGLAPGAVTVTARGVEITLAKAA